MARYLIIAGTSTIGSSVARMLLAEKHQLFLTGRDPVKMEALQRELPVEFAQLNACDFKAVDQIFIQAMEALEGLDGVVNCAGSLLIHPAHLTSQEQYQVEIDASLTTAFATVAAAGKHLQACGGSVVLISSAGALHGVASSEATSAAKAGIIGLTYAASASYAANNIRFNAVAPGLTDTSLTKWVTQNSASRQVSEAMHALGRIGTPQAIARAIAFFLHPENNWITGQVLAVDGGLSHTQPKNLRSTMYNQ